jgi:Holliday junction resolvase RusA-like endonuclease
MILEYPDLPPSINAVYKINRKSGVMYMCKEAKAFKEEFEKFARSNWVDLIHKFEPKLVYRVIYDFTFPQQDLLNDKYGQDKRIKSPYKKIDLDNRVKLLQDSLSFVFGFNDSHIFEILARKKCGKTRNTTIKVDSVPLTDYMEI